MTFGFGMGFPRASSAAGGPSLNLQFAGATALDPRITFTRASSGSYYDSTGILRSAANNVPRLDYNPSTLQPLGLLIEEARTNLLLNSSTLVTQNVTVTAVVYTLSFYGTGTVVLSGAATGSLVGSGVFPTRSSLTFTPTAGTLTLTVTGSAPQAQLEAGAFATSYIPTTTAAATRAADNAAINTLTPWYNQSESTVYAESAVFSVNTQTQIVWQVLGGADSTSLRSPQSTGARLRANVGNTFSGAATGAAITNNTFIKSAVAWQGLSGRLQSGATGENITAATTVSATQINIGSLAGGSFLNGHISTITYYPRRLSNTELQSITA